MQLSHLEKVVLVEQYGSIKQAAKELNMTQSSLSKLVRELENELNLTFFIRTAKGIALTEEGQMAFHLLKDIVVQLDKIRITAGKGKYLSGCLTIALSSAVYNALACNLLSEFKERYPRVQLRLIEKSTKEGLLAVAQNVCHLAVGSLMPEEEKHYLTLSDDLHIAYAALGGSPIKALISAHDPLAAAESICLADLNDRIVFNYMNDFLPLLTEHALKEISYTRCKIYNRETLKKLIFLTHGIAIVPEIMQWQDYYFESGLLIPKPIRDYQQIPQYYLFYPQTISFSPLANTFITILNQHLTPLTKSEVIKSCV